MNPETIRKDFKIFENRDIAYLDSGQHHKDLIRY